MQINSMEATHIGQCGFRKPWECREFDIFNDVWGTPDGKRYVELYLYGGAIVPYNWTQHGFIWTNEMENVHRKQK